MIKIGNKWLKLTQDVFTAFVVIVILPFFVVTYSLVELSAACTHYEVEEN